MFDTLENALDALVNATPVPTFVIDANHCVRHWNLACERILGYPASAMIGTNDQWKPFYRQRRPVMADLVASGCIDSLIKTYYAQKYRPSKTIPGSYEAEDFFPHLGHDGVWFYFTAAPIRGTDGQVIGAVETLQDITDRKRSEEAMRQGEARLRATVENTPSVMILWLDAEQRIVFANRAVEDMLGHTPDRLLGATPQEAGLLAGAAQGVLDEILAQVRAGQAPAVPREVQAFTAAGESRVLLIHAYDIPGPGDGARHALVATDVSAARRAEGALRREHLRLKSIIDHFPGGITLMDEQLRVVEHNKEFLRLLDFPAALFADGPPSLETLLRYNADRGEYEPCGHRDTADYVCSVLESASRPTAHAFERKRPDGTVLEVRGTPLPLGGFVTSYTDVSWRKQTEQQIKAVLDEHRVIFDNAHVGIAYIQGRKILRCNQRMAEIFGFDGPEALVGQKTWIYYPDRERWEAHGRQLYEKLAACGHSDGEVELRRRDGSPVWCYLIGRPLDPAKPHEGSIWVYSDITAKKQQESQLELASTVFDNSTEALLVCDSENRIVSVNRAFTRITGYQPEDVVGQRPSMFKSGRHDPAFYRAMWQSLMSDGRWEGEIWDRRKNGEVYPKWLSISVVRDEQQRVLHYVAAFTDITRRKAAEDRVHFLAHHDALTGLPNRVMVQDRFARSARQAVQNGRQLALLFLDMDQFKRVNDSLGHRTGDALLVAAVNRLRQCLRESDTISRQGGDEFVVLVEDIRTPDDAAGVARKIIGCMDTPFDIGGHALSTSFSIGVAMFPRDGRDFDTLLQKADTAMYHAKESGRSTFSFFDDRMNTEATERLALHGQLRQALARGELSLDFQPQSIIRSGRVFGAEALLRWRPASQPPVSPTRFIPIAEESGLILPIGEWVVHEAFRQARAWQDAGHPLQMSINVSGLQVFRTDLAATLAAAQRDTGVSARRIEIELTESILMEDADSAREVLGQLKRAGHSIAIDDFGTGYSSLAYLKKFPIDKLKIDRSFVTDLCGNPEDQAIARAIIQIARALDLRVVAEGVETPGQLALLRKHGCHEAQGYLIGRPGPAAEVLACASRPR